MHPKWIKYIQIFFNMIGCTSNYNGGFGENSIRYLIWSLHICTCSWCTIYAFKTFFDQLLDLMEFLDALNFLIYYIFCSTTYWLIIYDSCTKQKEESAFWQTFTHINNRFYSQSTIEKWSYLIAMICLLVADVSMLIITSIVENTSEPYTKLMHLIFLLICDSRIFFYLLHLKVISFHLERIETESKRSKKNCLKMHLKWIQSYFNSIHEMSVYMNLAFDLSNLALFLLSFYCSVTFLSFFYRQMQRKFFNFNSGLILKILNFLDFKLLINQCKINAFQVFC